MELPEKLGVGTPDLGVPVAHVMFVLDEGLPVSIFRGPFAGHQLLHIGPAISEGSGRVVADCGPWMSSLAERTMQL